MSEGPVGPVDARVRLRRRLLLAGLVPLLVVLALGLKVTLMLGHAAAGDEAYADGDHEAARASYADNGWVNVLERWIAPYDEGVAAYRLEDYDGAIALFTTALAHVPDQEECTVRINLALAHERVGDAAAEDRRLDEATEAWQLGVDALTDGACPTEAGRGEEQQATARAVDERLRGKLEEQQGDPAPSRPRRARRASPRPRPTPRRRRSWSGATRRAARSAATPPSGRATRGTTTTSPGRAAGACY